MFPARVIVSISLCELSRAGPGQRGSPTYGRHLQNQNALMQGQASARTRAWTVYNNNGRLILCHAPSGAVRGANACNGAPESRDNVRDAPLENRAKPKARTLRRP